MVILDNFITDQSLLDRIDNDDNFFGPNGNFMWWDGWWNSKTQSLKHELIEYIWKHNPPVGPFDIEGFEYWTGVYGPSKPNKSLGTHYDKDELHYKRTGEIIRPVIGTVFYPKNVPFKGGYLEIEHDGGEMERIQAKYNRLIIFQAGEDLHRVTHVTEGTRYAIAINLWDVEPVAVADGEMVIETNK
tara:strand:+ start:920 stop:1480 length:561 start_codon:yes stop_codon:yes gene_type:complete